MTQVTKEIANQIAAEIYKATFQIKKISKREELVEKILEEKFPNLKYEFIGEKSHSGANGRAKKSHGGYRINYRCGYGKHNYAPCILVK